ncbi:hypothetical protein BJY04DRAFT_146069 [Aspergillus karnatakaensis]|uniref:uncharacterized protein n=1 Tax=Aspergillus karnatakaensis TaxID=1810916 RepID=UPI003CCCD1EB
MTSCSGLPVVLYLVVAFSAGKSPEVPQKTTWSWIECARFPPLELSPHPNFRISTMRLQLGTTNFYLTFLALDRAQRARTHSI